MNLDKGFEVLNEYIGKDKSVKIIYRVRGILRNNTEKWIKILEFPIRPFHIWIKGTKTLGIYYVIDENNATFYVKPHENISKIKIEMGAKGVFPPGVFKNSEIGHPIHFRYRHLYVLSVPLNFPIKVLSPKGYSLRKTGKSMEYLWKKNKGITRNLILRILKA